MLAIASKRLAGELAVVHDADLDLVVDSPASAARRRATRACGSDRVMPTTSTPWRVRGVERRSCPSRSRCRARARPVPARASCRPSRAWPPGPPRACRRRARRSRSCRSSTGRGRARRTPAAGRSDGGPSARRVPSNGVRPAGAALPAAGEGGARQPAGRERGEHQPQTARRAERRRLPAVEQRDRGVDVVDLEIARDVGAPEAELAGRAQSVGHRPRRAQRGRSGPPSSVGAHPACHPRTRP